MSNMNGYAERLRLINNKIEEYTIDLTKILKSYNEASSKMTLYQIIALILILGGCFKVLEDCGSMQSLIKMIIIKFNFC